MSKVTARWIDFDNSTLKNSSGQLAVNINDSGATGSDIWSASKTKSEIDNAIAGLDFQKDVLDIQVDNTLDPGAASTGDRYIITDAANLHANFGTITGVADGDIVEYDGSAFVVAYDVSVAGEGALCWDRDSNTWQRWDGTSWSEFGGLSGVTAGAGLTKSGNILNVGAGNGITVNSDDIAVASDGTTGGDIAPVSVSANGVGVDVTALDGDHLDITYTPTNYVPSTAPTEAADVDDLAAHLAGIDTKLGDVSATADTKQLKVTATDTTEGYLFGKISAGDGISTSVLNSGGDEGLEISVDENSIGKPITFVHTITSTDVTNGYFSLTYNVFSGKEKLVRLFPTGGIEQVNKQLGTTATPDFDVLSQNQIHINNNGSATGLSGDLTTGDEVIVTYYTDGISS